MIHGQIRRTWAQTAGRCYRLSSALSNRGIGYGDTVAVLAPNILEFFEAHFGVPMTGAVLNPFNTRLDAATEVLEHDLIKFCRDNRASYKTPKTVIFGDLPKTSTGKVQKYKLRQQAMALGSR